MAIVHLDAGREWRGGQQQVLNLCRGLDERGVWQILVCPPGSPLAREAEAAHLRVSTLTMRGEWDFSAVRRLRRIIKSEGAGIVHAHDAHAHAIGLSAVRKLPDVRLAVSRRVDFEVSRHFFSRRKYLSPRVHFFAISTGIKEVLVRGGVPEERVSIIHSGVDPNRFSYDQSRERVRREFGIPDDAPVIGNIAGLVDHKGHRYLVDAALRVLAERPDAYFLIVGEGELREDLEKQIQDLGLQERVILTGFRKDVESFLSTFDLFALSSHLEGLCTSLIDAMLFRIPIVATETGGVPDLIRNGETGLLVPPRDPHALARGILQLLGNADLAHNLAEKARLHALSNFTSPVMVDATLAGYRQLLSSHQRM